MRSRVAELHEPKFIHTQFSPTHSRESRQVDFSMIEIDVFAFSTYLRDQESLRDARSLDSRLPRQNSGSHHAAGGLRGFHDGGEKIYHGGKARFVAHGGAAYTRVNRGTSSIESGRKKPPSLARSRVIASHYGRWASIIALTSKNFTPHSSAIRLSTYQTRQHKSAPPHK